MIDFVKMTLLAQHYGITLNDIQLSKLDKYAEMLVDWNTHINLTSITDPAGIMIRHFEDSMAFLKYVDVPRNASLIDVGTGAGFPGMVLKIVRNDIQVTLLDSLNKRITFLEAVAKEINEPVSAVHMRAEESGRKPEYREKFDIACARAVSNLRVLAEYCLPLVKVGGQFVSMKGPDAGDELDAARPGIGTLGGKISKSEEYMISDNSGRTIIVVDKLKSTPMQFPRPSVKINKKPI